MMSFLAKLAGDLSKKFESYKGDTVFLNAAAAACALVTAADGEIEDSEVRAAIKGMVEHDGLKAGFTPAAIDAAVSEALGKARTRAGAITLDRAIQAVATRPAEMRQDVLLLAADVADQGDDDDTSGQPKLKPVEVAKLIEIGQMLGIDAKKLLKL